MAAEEEDKKGLFKKLLGKLFSWESIDEIILAGALYPVLKGLALKVVEKFGKKAEDVLGLDFESAKNKTIDDFYFLAAQANLDEKEITRVYEFKHWLKEYDKDQEKPNGPDEETAFILYVAKMVKTFEREKGKVADGGKGNNQRQENTLRDGVVLATRFFKNLLSKANNEDMRHFLENEKVFTLIPKPKEDSPFAKKAKEFFKEVVDETVDGEKKNREDFNKTMTDWRSRAKAWRNSR